MANRRSFLQSTFGLGAGLFAGRTAAATPPHNNGSPSPTQVAARGGYLGVSSGSLSKLDSHAGRCGDHARGDHRGRRPAV